MDTKNVLRKYPRNRMPFFSTAGHLYGPENLSRFALLLGGMLLALQFGGVNSKGSSGPGLASSPSESLARNHDEHKLPRAQRQGDLTQSYDNERLCRAESQALARSHFASDEHLRASLAARLAKRYKIASKHADEILRTTAKVSKDHDVDPFLMLGIIAKESSFNQKAKSGYGAAGLMQVHAPSHKALLKTMGLNTDNLKSTEKSLQSEMQINVAAGVQIYKQYEKRYESRAKALQAYNGAKNDATFKYAKNVLGLRDAFSAEAAASIDCNKTKYALVNSHKQTS